MRKNIKYGKILGVIVLTSLIWIWADLAKTESFTVPNLSVYVAKSANPNLWISFDGKPSLTLKGVTLKASASKIADARRKINDGSVILQFFIDPEQEQITETGQLDTLEFLKKNDQIKQLGLTVESCDPNTIKVQVIKLEEKSLNIQCLDEDKTPLKVETIEPPKVNIYVPYYWGGDKLTAYILLSRSEIQQARKSQIDKTPYIDLVPGQPKKAESSVKVKLPPAMEGLREFNITSATIGFAFSPNLIGKYKTQLINPTDMATVSIKATPAAKRAYETQPFQMILQILDADEKTTDEKRRKVIYNFPEEFVRKDEIRLNQQPATAIFKLTPQNQ